MSTVFFPAVVLFPQDTHRTGFFRETTHHPEWALYMLGVVTRAPPPPLAHPLADICCWPSRPRTSPLLRRSVLDDGSPLMLSAVRVRPQ